MSKKEKPTLIIGHRGAAALFPENTILAFNGVLSLGVDILEIDIRMTEDRVLVTHHDESIDRMSNGTGLIKDFTYHELLAFNFAYGFRDLSGIYPYRNSHVRLPRLEDVLRNNYFPPLLLDLKESGERGYEAADQLNRLLRKYRVWDRVIVASFHDSIIRYFRKITQGRVKTAMGTYTSIGFICLSLLRLDFLFKIKSASLSIPKHFSFIKLDRRSIIEAAHRHQLDVYYWTINDKHEMQRLVRLGADGIITDRPDTLKEILKK